MIGKATLALGLGMALTSAVLQPAWADRAPTPEETSHIEAALRSAGFQKWEEIEFEENRWEVEDAVAADNKSYDVELDAQTFAVLERKESHDD